ncbi:hypothetical protein L6164_022389 [Bauhinia variegata]|uniref:Uncharacterized protein n=1 Tax=Bauhinia variegata TaxID=167791 RepID=A0ACB9MF26_BAUVA|nr:hypothetical protein L6164_022389 [Bauhinia variegata]
MSSEPQIRHGLRKLQVTTRETVTRCGDAKDKNSGVRGTDSEHEGNEDDKTATSKEKRIPEAPGKLKRFVLGSSFKRKQKLNKFKLLGIIKRDEYDDEVDAFLRSTFAKRTLIHSK